MTSRKVLTLPHGSTMTVVVCFATLGVASYLVATHEAATPWLAVVAFFIGGYVTDWFSGLAHFGFDYVWPPQFPILGPIAVDFRGHHERPGLDPSAVLVNLTKGAYGSLPIALITIPIAIRSEPTPQGFLIAASFLMTSVWMLGFHQIHSYAHMGKAIPAEEFNRAVADIVRIPDQGLQREAFARLFAAAGIPRWVRVMQRSRLFLRPEIHWRHHHTFETDFSSVNGWSDPLMNLLYRPLSRRMKARVETTPAEADGRMNGERVVT